MEQRALRIDPYKYKDRKPMSIKLFKPKIIEKNMPTDHLNTVKEKEKKYEKINNNLYSQKLRN